MYNPDVWSLSILLLSTNGKVLYIKFSNEKSTMLNSIKPEFYIYYITKNS